MKYIMMTTKLGGLEVKIPIIFPNALNHCDVEKAMRTVEGYGEWGETKSAGTFTPIDNKCSGESITLKLDSTPDDATTINCYDYTHGLL